MARTRDLVERLEDAAGRLAAALNGELTVAGAEARAAQVRADAAAVEAAAHRETETARTQTREALTAADAQRHRADEAVALSADLRGRLHQTAAELGAVRTAERAARDQVTALTTELRQERLRAEAVTAEHAHALRDALLQRDRALETTRSVHERMDRTRTALTQQRTELDEQVRLVGELQAKVGVLAAERDAARNEAERARRRIDQFITDGRQGRERTAADSGAQNVRAFGQHAAGRPDSAGARQPDGTVSILHRLPGGNGYAPAAVSGDG